MNFLRKFVDLILYSSLWIAICAAAQVQLTYMLTGRPFQVDAYTLFIFFSTIGLYSIHRIVGMDKVRAFEHEGRFAVIKKYAGHIRIYGTIGLIGSGVFWFMLPWQTWLWLIAPIAISLGYVVPTGSGRPRLRDFHYIKLFLLAIAWSMLTTVVPLVHTGFTAPVPILLIFAERAFFLIAITIPFDIRDLKVDASTSLATLPSAIGIRRSKVLATLAMCLSAAIVLWLVHSEVYPVAYAMPFALLFVLTVATITGSSPQRNDYYYSGLMDGLMIVGPLIYLIMQPAI